MTLVTRTELRRALGGVSTASIYRWEKKGVIPRAVRRPGMLPRWVLEDVLAELGLGENKTKELGMMTASAG